MLQVLPACILCFSDHLQVLLQICLMDYQRHLIHQRTVISEKQHPKLYPDNVRFALC